MTVEELIEKLMEVEDKTKVVRFNLDIKSNGYYESTVTDVIERSDVVLYNW